MIFFFLKKKNLKIFSVFAIFSQKPNFPEKIKKYRFLSLNEKIKDWKEFCRHY